MKRKRKMERIRYRAGWRPEVFTASWVQRLAEAGWEVKTQPLEVRTTASGLWRIADPPLVIGGVMDAPSVICNFAIRRGLA